MLESGLPGQPPKGLEKIQCKTYPWTVWFETRMLRDPKSIPLLEVLVLLQIYLKIIQKYLESLDEDKLENVLPLRNPPRICVKQ